MLILTVELTALPGCCGGARRLFILAYLPGFCAGTVGYTFDLKRTLSETAMDLLRVRNFCRLAKLQKMSPSQLISAVSINTCRFANFLQFRSC